MVEWREPFSYWSSEERAEGGVKRTFLTGAEQVLGAHLPSILPRPPDSILSAARGSCRALGHSQLFHPLPKIC